MAGKVQLCLMPDNALLPCHLCLMPDNAFALLTLQQRLLSALKLLTGFTLPGMATACAHV